MLTRTSQRVSQMKLEEEEKLHNKGPGIRTMKVNRAPTLTLWVAVVAKCRGFPWATALTLGYSLSKMFAISKGRSLGVYDRSKKASSKKGPVLDSDSEDEGISTQVKQQQQKKKKSVTILGRRVSVAQTDDGVRALGYGKQAGQPLDHTVVQAYLTKAFGSQFLAVKKAMTQLASSYKDQDELDGDAYSLYEQFRPAVPAGKKGWGRKGILDLDYVLSLKPAV